MRTLDFSDGFESNVQPSIVGVDAIEIAVTPAGTISSDNVQAALEELDSEKVAKVSSTDNAVTRFDGTSGDVQNSGVIVDDSNNVSGVANLTATGTAQLLGTSNSDTTISIGTGTGANTINIGGANTTVNVNGSVNNQNVTNLDVDDKLVTINKGGAAGSGAVAGFDIEEGGSSTGYIKTSADRNSFEVKAPNTAGIASITPGGSNDEVALLAKAQTLSNKKFSDPLHLAEQGSAPSTPASGFKKIYPKSDGKIYSLDSSGVELEVGSGAGGSGGKNYLSGLFDGSTVTGINRYADAAAATPVDGTGGSPNITAAALNTSTPLRGTSSQRLSKDASSRQGEGWSTDFTVDRADYEGSKTLIVSFNYKTSSNYVANDVRMFVYDKDNSVLLNVISLTNDGSLGVASNTTKFVGSFNTVSTSNDYRLIFHITSTTSAAWDLDVIDLKVSPEQTVPGVIGTGETPYTPTFAGLGTVASVDVVTWRDKQYAMIRGTFTTGTTAASAATLTLPTNLTIATLSTPIVVGTWERSNAGTAVVKQGTLIAASGGTTLAFGSHDTAGSYNPFTGRNGNEVFGTGEKIQISAMVPISGWSATAALSTTEAMAQSASWTGYHSSDSSWARTSTSLGDPTADSTSTFTEITNFNMGTVTSALSGSDKLPGIVFTPQTMNRYKITANFGNWGPATANVSLTFQLIDQSGNVLAQMGRQTVSTFQEISQLTLVGILTPTSTNTAHTVKIQSSSSSGTVTIAGISRSVNWTIEQMPNLTAFSTYGQTALYPTSGYSSGGLVSYAITAGQYGDLASVSLPPGEYDASLNAVYYSNGVTSTTNVEIGLSTTTGNSSTGLILGETLVRQIKNNTSTTADSLSLTVPGIVVTSTTTYYFKATVPSSITNMQIGWSWRFRKVK